MFPESFTFSIADWVNGWVDSLVTNYGDVFRHISDTLLWAIVNLEGLLRAAPWWLMLAIVGGVAWHALSSRCLQPPRGSGVRHRP